MKKKAYRAGSEPNRKEYMRLGKKITLGLMTATLLMDATGYAAQATEIDGPYTNDDHRVAGIEYLYGQDDVHNGSLTVTGTGVVGTEDVPVDAYGGFVVDWTSPDVPGHVYGPHNAYSNVLNQDEGGINWGDSYGAYTGYGDAYANHLNVYGYSYGDLYGAKSGQGAVYNNFVSLEGDTEGDIYGGYSGIGNVSDNNITVKGKVDSVNGNGDIIGGYTGHGMAEHNIININKDATIADVSHIYGGQSINGKVEKNEVHIEGKLDNQGQNSMTVAGGITGNSSAEGNIVSLDNDQELGNLTVNGGQSDNGGASNNQANIKGTMTGTVVGGSATGGDADNNTVNVDPHAGVTGTVMGGSAVGGNADGNTVNVAVNSKVTGDVIGGKGEAAIDKTVQTSGNTVNANGNIEGNVTGGKVVNDGYASSNHVNANGTISGNVIGGVVGNDGDASGNIIAVNGTVGGSVTGGTVGNDGDASGNIIAVNGTVGGSITGGSVDNTGSADGNNIQINSAVKGDVTGGKVGQDGTANKNNIVANKDVTGNVIGGTVGHDGDANGNDIGVGGAVAKDVTGGSVGNNGNAGNNQVTVGVSGTVSGSVIGGFVGHNGNAGSYVDGFGNTIEGNKIQINNVVKGDVTGGKVVNNGTANENQIVINKDVTGNVTGGTVGNDGDANGNSIGVGGKVTGNVVGGTVVNNGTANINNITIIGTVEGNVSGGAVSGSTAVADDNQAHGNTVKVGDTIAGEYKPGTVIGNIIGGQVAGSGAADDNEVIISKDSNVDGIVVGADVYGSATAENNIVSISGGTVQGAVGAYSHGEGDLTNNEVSIDNRDGQVVVIASGAVSESSSNDTMLSGNNVSITDGNIAVAVGADGKGAASAVNNWVVIENGTVTMASGAEVNEADKATNNHVTVAGGNVDSAAGAVSSGSGILENNYVNVMGGQVNKASGAISTTGDTDLSVQDNHVYVSNGTVGNAYGANINGNASAEGNSVELLGGKIENAYGAEVNNAETAVGNWVNIIGDSNVAGEAVGASGVMNDLASDNSVEISSSKANVSSATGAINHGDGDMTSNYVNVKDGQVDDATGAFSYGKGDMDSNKVNVSNGSVGIANGAVSASDSADTKLTNNAVDISGGTVDAANGAVVLGSATADGNKVSITDGEVGQAVGAAGVPSRDPIIADGALINNNVTIDGANAAVDTAIGAYGYDSKELHDNTVDVLQGTVGDAIGATFLGKGNTEVHDNEVHVKGGTIENAYGARSSGEGDVKNNAVKVDGGNITGDAVGALSTSDDKDTKLTNNEVILSKGTTSKINNAYGAQSDGAAAAYDNAVIVNGGEIIGDAVGAAGLSQSGTGEFVRNEVKVDNDAIVGTAIGAANAGTGVSRDNHVAVNDGAVGTAIGAQSTSISTNENKAILKDNSVDVNKGTLIDAYGAKVEGTASADGNEVVLNGGKVGSAYGAVSESVTTVDGAGNDITIKDDGSLTENSVIVNDKSATVGTAIGAEGENSTLSGNKVHVINGTVENALIGASHTGIGDGDVKNNTVVVDDGNVNGVIAAGAQSAGTGEISGNKVTVNNTNGLESVVGAVSYNTSDKKAQVKGNSIEINNSSVADKVYGALVMGTADAEGNKAVIDNGQISDVYGAYGTSAAMPGVVINNGKLDGNEVIIKGDKSEVNNAIGAISNTSDTIDGNKVTLNGGTVNGSLVGGTYTGDGNSNVNNNVVVITGGKADGSTVTGGQSSGVGDVSYNSVNVTGGTAENTQITGAINTNDGNMKGNTVTIDGGKVDGAVAAGAQSAGTGEISGNKVTVNNTNGLESVVGAVSYNISDKKAQVKGNSIEINNSNVADKVYGALVMGTADAEGNKAVIDNGQISDVYGAYGTSAAMPGVVINNGKLDGNEVTIKGDKSEVNNAIGAISNTSDTIDSNIVNVNAGTVKYATGAFGGGELTNNEVNIGKADPAEDSNSAVLKANPAVDSNPTVIKAEGASSLTSKKLSGNKVNVNSGIVGDNNNAGSLTGAVYLGSSSTEVSGNSVNIKGGEIASNTLVTGATSTGSGLVSGNSVTVENPNAVIDNVVGASVLGKADATGNEVVISSGKVNMAVGAVGMSDEKSSFSKNAVQVKGGTVGNVVGTTTKVGDISESKVTVSGGEVTGGIIGGVSETTGNVSASEVAVSGGTVANAIIGGVSETGNVSASKITISGGTVIGSISGGKSTTGDVADSTILLSGGTVNGSVFGGISDKGAVRNNVITIKDNANLDGAKLYGYGGKAEGGHSGNTLNIEGKIVYNNFDDIRSGNWNWSTWSDRGNQKLNTIGNFDNINIDEAVWGTPAITVENLVLNNTNVHVNHVFAPSVFKQSTVYSGKGAVLIKADNVIGDLNPNSKIDRVDFGVAFTAKDVPINLNHISSEAEYTIDPRQMAINEQTSVIGESRAAATALVNQGSDFMVTALRSMSKAESLEGGVSGAKAFIGGFGNSSKYTTGSHVKVNGWSGIAGVGSTTESGFTWGVFVETGRGNYSTRNNVYDVELHGDGDADYTGGGVGIRQDYDDGLYFDAGFRAGKMNNKLKDALWGPNGGFYGYDVSSNYYGAHIGVGKVFQNGKNSTMEVYGRYAYTHNKGKDFIIAGDEFNFDAMDSHRTQIGVMWENQVNSQFKVRYGLGYEYEFGGKAGSSVMGYDLTAPSLRGGSLLYQLGMTYQMSDNTSIDLGLTGHSGKRQGISGNLMFNVSF